MWCQTPIRSRNFHVYYSISSILNSLLITSAHLTPLLQLNINLPLLQPIRLHCHGNLPRLALLCPDNP